MLKELYQGKSEPLVEGVDLIVTCWGQTLVLLETEGGHSLCFFSSALKYKNSVIEDNSRKEICKSTRIIYLQSVVTQWTLTTSKIQCCFPDKHILLLALVLSLSPWDSLQSQATTKSQIKRWGIFNIYNKNCIQNDNQIKCCIVTDS